MAWSRLQSASSSASSSPAAVLGTNLSSGSKLIAYVYSNASTISSVKDTAGNNFVQLISITVNASDTFAIWVLDTPAGDVGATTTISATTGGSTGSAILVQEIAGLLAGTTTAILDGTQGTSTGTGNTPSFTATFGAYSSTLVNEFLVVFTGDDGGQTGNTWPATIATFTSDANNVNTDANADINIYFKNSSGGSDSPASQTVTCSGATNWETLVVAFKLAATATGGPPQPPQPGPRSWRARFKPPQTPFAPNAAFRVPAPAQLPPVPRRRLARAVWAGRAVPGQQPIAHGQPPYMPPRRRLARAVVQFIPVPGSVPAAGGGIPQPPQPGPASWRHRFRLPQTPYAPNAPAAGAVATPVPVQLPPIPRRRLARAVVQFIPPPVPAIPNGTVQPLAAITVPRRRPARAYVQFTPVRTVIPARVVMADDGDAPWHIRIRRRRT